MNAIDRIALAACALAASACSHLPDPVPAALVPSPAHRATETLAAAGVQIYECRRGSDGTASWVFVAPEAELFDAAGRRVGSHGAGPYWQALDGSRIVGKLQARADAPISGAIHWLLLAAQDAGPPGAFSRITHVQRLHTRGGVAPDTPCTPDQLGRSARVAYTADYRFFTHHPQ